MSGPGLGATLVRAVIGSAGVSVLGMGFTFLLGVQLARGLGAEGYGVYGLAMAVVAILGVPSQFGLPQLLTREVAATSAHGDWAGMNGVLSWSLRTAAWTSAVIMLLFLAWVLLLGPGLSSTFGRTLLIASMLIPFVSFVSLQGAALRGLLHIVKGQVPDTLIRPAVYSLLLLLLYLCAVPLSPVLAMAAGVVAASVALVVAWAILRRTLPRESLGVQPSRAGRRWFSASLPMALTEGMRIIQGQAAIVALGWLSTLATVGHFRVAASTLGVVAMPLTVFNTATAPMIARLHATGDRQRLQRLLTHAALGMTAATTLLSLPFLVAGEPLMAYVFGQDFTASAPIIRILCIGVIVNGGFGANAILLNMTGFERRVTRVSIVSASLLFVMLLLLASKYDGQGAAWAVALALIMWNVLLWIDAKRLVGVDTSMFGFVHNFRNSE